MRRDDDAIVEALADAIGRLLEEDPTTATTYQADAVAGGSDAISNDRVESLRALYHDASRGHGPLD